MFPHVPVSKRVHLMCFVIFFCCDSGTEGKPQTVMEKIKIRLEERTKLCSLTNLSILPISDSKMNTVTVTFQLTHPRFKDCYNDYGVLLKTKGGTKYYAMVKYNYDTKKTASHTFENVSCGSYNVTIKLRTQKLLIPDQDIGYPEPINMSSIDCNPVQRIELLIQSVKEKIIIITAVIFAILVLSVGGLIYYFYWSGKCKGEMVMNVEEDNLMDIEGNRNPAQNIEVYILHYYDQKKVIKKKVEIVKDFLLKSSYFSTVKVIEDELAVILFDINDWLNDILDEEGKDGSIRKIILIASDETNEEEECEIENLIYFEFIKKLKDDMLRCLTGYDNLFVVQFDGSSTYPEKLKHIVRRDRYSLSGESIHDHLIDLCLNLCSGSKLDMCDVEKTLKELLLKHPVRHLGNMHESC